ncbi:MAG TPA: Nramp family divalent metal transporter [Vicinamibacteria bacterium]|nr:Nramp family divalent metal transporter [Vicinamibacteria bacterium]
MAGTSQGTQPAARGGLPPWNVAELPPPRPYTFRNVMAVIGPGAIMLSMSIGSGEWHFGPATVVRYGAALMWVVTLGILLQLVLNLQFIRYTMYTGEPAAVGFMRTWPGAPFWATVYILLALSQNGWPGWAALSASSIFSVVNGRMPGPGDQGALLAFGYLTFGLTLLIVTFGGKIERTLEWVNWFMVAFIVLFLLTVNLLFVPWSVWWEVLRGHVQFGYFPPGADWVLIGALAGFAGNGGIGNVGSSNYIRDKGLGMGSVVGYIPAAVGGRAVKVSPVGSVFPTTAANMGRWRAWWRYVLADQVLLWAAGCFVGMYLNVVLAAAVIPPGTDMAGVAAGSMQADFLGRVAGPLARMLTLLTGFWVLFGSQLTITDLLVRFSTDILWSGSGRVRRWARDDIRRVYYTLIVAAAVWGCVAINLARPATLLAISANAAGFILMVAGTHILVVNHRLLPREVRGPWWERAGVGAAVVFYAFFFWKNVERLLFA